MDKLIITGGVRLKGEVVISGAKNAALPVMAATILSSGENIIRGVPHLVDVMTMGRLLANLGAGFHLESGDVIIDSTHINNCIAPYELVKTMRASVLVLGPLVARYGMAKVSLPGGCAIGARPIDLHLSGLSKMGAEIELDSGYVIAKARSLKGAHIYLDIPTVTGTENLMMAATLARGITTIENSAREPEVVDLSEALKSMGARIKGAGTGRIEIEGVKDLSPMKHSIIPDRVETGTFLTMAGITGGNILIKNCIPEHNEALIMKLRETGMEIEEGPNFLKAKGSDRIIARDVKTMPYPGFPTDMQAQYMALMCLAKGTSLIKETVFENRFMHVAELRRMGADIEIEGGVSTVKGVERLKGAEVMATDLRASASLIVAGLAAEGVTVIHRLYHLDRGYERIEEKLRVLGALIRRVRE